MLRLLLVLVFLFFTFVPKAEAGQFINPVSYTHISTYFSSWHPGIDLATDCSVPIYAVEGGTVTTGWEDYGYGNYITINNGYNNHIYGHLSGFNAWSGEVGQGALIGWTGNTGRSYGCHLHYEVWWEGQAVDPTIVLPL